MSEIQKTGAVALQPAIQSGFNFFDPVQFETMQRVCKLFASSELVPDMYKAKAELPPNNATEAQLKATEQHNKAAMNKAISNCMIAIEIAQRIGASPLMVMQNMVPIYGKPSWSSKFLVATVNSCGRFNPLQYRFAEKGMLGMVDYTDYEYDPQSRRKVAVNRQFDGKKIMDIECVAYTTAKGSDKVLESSPVSIRLAIQEGWYTKNGSKWQTMTKQMLMYRAASFWTSAYAPELSMGMRTIEEQQDIIDIDFDEVNPSVEAQVEQEKAQHANRVVIGFDPATPGADKTTEVIVDTQTGELFKVEHQEQQAAQSPDF